jgi:hypothetical protein
MPEVLGCDNKDETTHRVYVILGTSHQIQCRWRDASPNEAKLSEELQTIVRELLGRYSITLIAEEAPHDVPTMVRLVANEAQLPYLQVDMPSGEYGLYGIRQDMDMLATLNSGGTRITVALAPMTYGSITGWKRWSRTRAHVECCSYAAMRIQRFLPRRRGTGTVRPRKYFSQQS